MMNEDGQLEIVDFGKEKPGVGAQEAKFVAGVGIVGMRERMRQLGGACEIISMETATAVIARIL